MSEAPDPELTDAPVGATAKRLEELSLTQALLDVEVANARVTDLTRRLLELSDDLAAAQRELELVRRQHEQLYADFVGMHQSRAFQMTQRMWQLRRALRV